MDGAALQDKISRGMGRAARKLGLPFIVYRPRSALRPICGRNRIIKLYASFTSKDETFKRVAAYGQAIWLGVFDSGYTQAGDYLVGTEATFFISAQRSELPVQCVRVNRIIDVLRTPAPGLGGYAGQIAATAVPILTAWPASVLAQNSRLSGSSMESKFGNWTMLLPTLPIRLEAGDIVQDDIGQTYVIGSAEQSDLGWRIAMRQIAA